MKTGVRQFLLRHREPLLRHRAGIAAALAFLLLGAVAFLSTPASWRPGSDGFYSYLYARSLAFDGDLNFTNDYLACGDPFRIGQDRGTGRPDNIFYAGPALFWVPILIVMRVLGLAGDGCGPPATFACFLLTPILGALALFFTYLFVARWFKPGVSACAVALVFFGGPLLLISASLPSYSHTYDLFFASLLCWLSARQNGSPKLALAAALCLAGLILQRASNLPFVALPLVALHSGSVARSPKLRASAIVLSGAILGVVPLLVINAYLYGAPFTFSHGPYFMNFGNAHPFLTLFNAEEGLFLFWPTVWVAVLGAFLPKAPGSGPMLRTLGAIGLLGLLIVSSALDWAPARRLSNLAPLFALLSAGVLARLYDWLSVEPGRFRVLAAGLALAPLAAWSLGTAWGAPRGYVDHGKPVQQRAIYGGGVRAFWALTDDSLGRVAIAPAELWFAARYGLPRSAFGEAAHARWYSRDFRTLVWQDRRIDLAALARLGLTEGLAPEGKHQVRMRSAVARAVFSTQWPHVTHVALIARSEQAARLRLGVGGLTSVAWLPEQPVGAREKLVFDVSELKLGSGLHELYLEAQGAPGSVVIEGLEFDDRVPRVALVRP